MCAYVVAFGVFAVAARHCPAAAAALWRVVFDFFAPPTPGRATAAISPLCRASRRQQSLGEEASAQAPKRFF